MATPIDTIPRRLFAQADERPDAPAHHSKVGGVYHPKSYRMLADEVRRLGKAFIALGQAPGFTTCILGFNRSEWVAFDLATMTAGGAPAGIYSTCSPEEVAYIIQHAASEVVLVENDAQLSKVLKMLSRLPLLKRIVMMRGAASASPANANGRHPLVQSYEEFLTQGDAVTDAELFSRLDALEPQGLATLIYTSGTTGPPKGVMLSHENLAWTAELTCGIVRGSPRDCVLSYLPLSHIAEQVFTIHGPITMGASVYFAESIDKIAENLKEVQPTIFFGVPRIWEKLHAGIAAKLKEAEGAKKKLVEWAIGVAREANAERMRGEEPRGALKLQYALAQRLVLRKLKSAIGLSRASYCISGAAPIAKEVLEFFVGLDVLVSEVYGQSEDTGPTTMNLRDNIKLGTVGTRFPGIEVQIAADGEIVVRGPNVFLGYYKEPQATAETLIDGWMHSGDLGQFDQEGFLSITGRKKEIIITAGGKNIAPKNIEAELRRHPPIAEAVVIGDRRKYLTVLVVLDAASAGQIAGAEGEGVATLKKHPAVLAAVQRALDEVNATLARVETVKRFFILEQPFTIEGGELTPTLKLKRRVVHDRYAREIEEMYAE